VTVSSGPSTDFDARAIARLIADPVELTAARVDHSEHYTKTRFVQFKDSAVLQRIFEIAVKHYSGPSHYILNPHLSLIYKKLDKGSQRTLCNTLDVPIGTYGFDRVRMIETELPIEDDGPVRRWRFVCGDPLAGS
jgi:hypothetical protein